jgi:hypothetical protein
VVLEKLQGYFEAKHGNISFSLFDRLRAFRPTPAAPEEVGPIPPSAELRIGTPYGQIFAPSPTLNGMALEIEPGARLLGLPTFIVRAQPLQWITIRRGANGPVLALIHAGAPVVSPSPGGGREYNFAGGSLWLVANLLAASAPASGFAGIAITSATLDIPPPFVAGSADEIVIGASVTAALGIVPAPASAAPPGFSNQGSSAVVTLPARLGLALAPGGVQVTALEDAALFLEGQNFLFSGGWSSTSFDGVLNYIALAYHAVTPQQLSFPPGAGGSVQISGTAAVTGCSWRLPVSLSDPTQLGPAASGGMLDLALRTGLAATWGTLEAPVPLGAAQLQAEYGGFWLTTTSAARRLDDTYSLWDGRRPPSLPPRATYVTFVASPGAGMRIVETTTIEAVIVAGCRIEAHLDRPLTVQGKPLGLAPLEITFVVERTSAGELLSIFGQPGTPGLGFPPPQPEVVALANALFYTLGVQGLFGMIRLAGARGVAGELFFESPATRVLPTLPDPYATSFARPLPLPASSELLALVAWSDPANAALSFELDLPTGGSVEDLLGVLLDVSSNSDQFGLEFLEEFPDRVVKISGQTLQYPARGLALIAPPHISWEAVISDTAIDPTTNLPVPAPRELFPPFAVLDGQPVELRVLSQTLRPVDVRLAIADCIAEYSGGAQLRVTCTLPFGIIAIIDSLGSDPEGVLRPTFSQLSANFGPTSRPLTAGIQLRLQGVTDDTHPQAALPGSASASDPYAQAMLGAAIASTWQGMFDNLPPLARVPVSVVDLCGYGASFFSYWQNLTPATGIDEVRFDVLVGRTSYELVQLQSYILPGVVPLVNTTIFQRDAAGYAARHNPRHSAGWVAKGPGEFAYPGSIAVEQGALVRIQNVHNIRETGAPNVTVSEPGDSFVYLPVTFDADLVFLTDPAQHGLRLAGDPPGGIIPTRGMTGYVAMTVGFTPTLAHAIALLDQVAAVNAAPAAGPISIDASVGSTGIGYSLTSVDIKATRSDVAPRTLAVAVRGTPHLPRDGAWSVSRRTPTDKSPAPIDPLAPVPLVRAHSSPASWHMAEPEDVVKLGAPNTLYGLVQGTGTQKVLFEHPTVVDGATSPLQPRAQPQMADVGSLLGIPGLLPDLGSLLDLGPFAGFKPSSDGLAMQTIQKPGIAIPLRTLITLGPVQVTLASYPPSSSISISLDAAAAPGNRWSVSVKNLAFGLVVTGFGDPSDPLILVHGDASARDGAAPTLTNLAIDYGQALSVVANILNGIETIKKLLPGSPDTPFSIDFTGTALKIRESFGLPQLPLGLGYLQDIALDLGFDLDLVAQSLHFFVGVGTDQDPFSWLVSPLAGNGILQLGATDRLGVKLQAGIGAGLGIDLEIASGSATVVLAAQIDTTVSPLVLMILLTGNASVDVLDGLASVSLTLTAGVGIGVTTPPIDPASDPIEYAKETTVTLSAEVAVAIHLSVCWVTHVDWNGSWPFSETVSGQTLTSLV